MQAKIRIEQARQIYLGELHRCDSVGMVNVVRAQLTYYLGRPHEAIRHLHSVKLVCSDGSLVREYALGLEGWIYASIGHFTQAKYQLVELVRRTEMMMGTGSVLAAAAMQMLVPIEIEIEDLEEAERLLDCADAIYEEVGEEERGIGDSTERERAMLSSVIGEIDSALEHASSAVLMSERQFGTHHPWYAESLLVLSEVQTDLWDFESARALQLEALGIISDTFGENHRQVAWALRGICETEHSRGDLEAALEHCQRAASIYPAVGLEQTPTYQRTLADLGAVHCDRGEWNRGLEHLQRALKLCEELYDPLHNYCQDIVSDIDGCVEDLLAAQPTPP